MDRLLIAEMPPFALTSNIEGIWEFTFNSATDYRTVAGSNNNYWVHEQQIDLSGYLMSDLTTYFRQSFEQRAGIESVTWTASSSNPAISFNLSVLEMVVVSTVPLTDANIFAAGFGGPGFLTYGPFANPFVDNGNFNREHIIHGRQYLHGVDSTLGADNFTSNGSAYTRLVQERDFSSLEPIAVEKLYVYRVFYLPDGAGGETPDGKLRSVGFTAARVILDATMDKEADIEYLMRLKRGYELANQV